MFCLFLFFSHLYFGQIKRFQESKTNWPEVSKILKEENYYVGYSEGLKKLAKENNLKFFDSNKWIETDETIFCDSVHLNDLGNNILYECIIGEL